MTEFREFAPHPALAPFVRSYWTFRGGAGLPAERILPDGTFDLVFHLGDPFHRDGMAQPRAMFIGEPRRPVIVTPSARPDVFGVRFRIGGAASFLRMPLRQWRDAFHPLEAFDPRLAEEVGNAGGTAERIELVERCLLRRLSVRDGGRRVRGAIAEIVRTDGSARIEDVARRVGATTRTLERLFDDSVGIGPKTLARLIRFRAALQGRDEGYFDDAHRIREFRRFSGLTPRQWQREQNRLNDAFDGNVQSTGGSAL